MTFRHHPRNLAPARIVALVAALATICGLAGVNLRAATAQSATPVATPLATPAADIERHDFTVDLGDFETAAQLTYPAGEDGPFPTVILIPGSGPADMNVTVANPQTGAAFSSIFLDIANRFSANGYAVARYNKHYVDGSGGPELSQTYFENFTLPMLLEDAGRVYDAVRGLPQVDPERIVLYGWSEGSTVATQLALAQPEIAGLILQGPVPNTWEEIFRYQNEDVVVSFLRDIVDSDGDGAVSFDELNAAAQQHPGSAIGYAFFLAMDPAATGNEPSMNPVMDQNGDNLLSIDEEVVPALAGFFANFDERSASGESPYGPQYASDQQLAPVIDTIGELTMPILILQGEQDGTVPPEGARQIDEALAAAGHPDHTLNMYPGLGHTLGPAPTVYDDDFAPIAAEPLADIVTWLDDHLGP